MSEKITCELCGSKEHSIQKHLAKSHTDISLDEYRAKFPNAPLMSEMAKELLRKKREEKGEVGTTVEMSGTAATVSQLIPKGAVIKRNLHEVFELGTAAAAMSKRGEPIPITVFSPHGQQEMVPALSENYVYNIDELKNVILALELNIPCLVWGHKGAGKSELVEQVCSRTNRPMIRIQHTVNTEESHILGQYTVKGGETIFELGPLPLAMLNGWVYCADEYDFGMPSVLAVYQPVLEGKSLLIKEAPPELRTIKPHKDFRFVSTGNTNGSGDETGLYQGTLIQNSANYDRFGMVINKQYMPKDAEMQILQNHCKLTVKDSEKMVDFAKLIRDAYDGAKMSDTISPRTLIYASRIGVMRGSFRQGLELSFISKLSKVDREVAQGIAQRIFA